MEKLYLQDTYLYNFEATILNSGEDNKGFYITLDKTAFYPQGGGQPADHGNIYGDNFEANIIHVAYAQDEIRHYLDLPIYNIAINSKIKGIVDKNRRILNARFHTAAHLIGNIAEINYPTLKAIKGHSFPGEAYVEFSATENDFCTTELQSKINDSIKNNFQISSFQIDQESFEKKFYKLPYTIPGEREFRSIQIGEMPPVPCGGTHLFCLNEIGEVVIIKAKHKNNLLRVSYEVKWVT